MAFDLAFKQIVVERYRQLITSKIHSHQRTLEDLIQSTRNETKSSAGDKYETARAMLQIEQDNVRRQLAEAMEQRSLFDKLDFTTETPTVKPGSLLKTNKGLLFLSVALGKIQVDNETIIAMSAQSPLGKNLLNLKAGDQTVMNAVEYRVQEII